MEGRMCVIRGRLRADCQRGRRWFVPSTERLAHPVRLRGPVEALQLAV
jgi:hypothetical protein